MTNEELKFPAAKPEKLLTVDKSKLEALMAKINDFSRCKHPSNRVTADICEGDWPDHAVQWCRDCGAYRTMQIRFNTMGEWRTPDERDSVAKLRDWLAEDCCDMRRESP